MFPLVARPDNAKKGASIAERPFTLASEEYPGAPTGVEHDPAELILKIKRWVKNDAQAISKWRQEARDDYDMVAGIQWTQADTDILNEQRRPPVTFNRIGPFIDSVEGQEINNRTETNYLARTLEDQGSVDLLNAAAKWVRDGTDAEDEETGAFRDVAICGMGWTDTRPDYDDDPDGAISIRRVDPLEMGWDASASSDNLSDARRVWRVRSEVPIEDARAEYPDATDEELDGSWALSYLMADADEDAAFGNGEDDDRLRDTVTIVECQWWEYETAYRIVDPTTGRFIRVDAEKFKVLTGRYQQLVKVGALPKMPKAVKDRTKCYWKAIVGNDVLKVTRGPEEGGFTLKCMTGKRDRNAGSWYGLVRGMKDPQRWANKWLSQAMHVMNSNAKGGVIIEKSAIENVDEFVDEWSNPDSVSVVADGTLAQGRIKEKEIKPFPDAIGKLMEFAIASIPAAAGINPEMLGQTTSMQPGVAAAEMGRKQQAMAILAGLFNAKRRYMKEQGRLLLWLIRNVISDGRLVRIGGAENAQYVPLVKMPDTARYDVVVDDTPTSPNMKDRTWTMLLQLMPMLRTMSLPPQVWLEIMKYSPLPESLTGKVEKIAQEAMQQQPQGDPAAQAFAEAERAKATKLNAETAAKIAEVQMEPERIALEREKVAAQVEATRAGAIKSLTDAQVARQGAELDAAEAASRSLLGVQDQVHRQTLDTAGAVHKANLAERGQAAKENIARG